MLLSVSRATKGRHDRARRLYGLRRWLAWLAALAFSSIVAAVVAELVFRHVLLEHKVPRTEAGFEYWVSSAWPRPIPVERDPDRLRILSLADSFGEAGEPSEGENYIYRLERELSEAGLDVEAVNLSVGEYTLLDELELYRRFGARYAPNLVLHGVFIGNDTQLPPGDLMEYGDISVRTEPDRGLDRPLLPAWIGHRLIANANARAMAEQDPGEEVGLMSRANFARVQRRALEGFRDDDSTRARWERALEVIDTVRDEVSAQGGTYVMLIHPDRVQVETHRTRHMLRRYSLDPARYDLDLPQILIRRYCQQAEIVCVDLLPAFREQGSGGGLYRFRDTHYAPEGNALAAREAGAAIRQHGLLTPRP